MPVTYDPSVFYVQTQDEAKRIILTSEDSTTEERWAKETPYLLDMITNKIPVTPQSLVLDYGCGVGRLSKGLILKTGCKVVGVDISPSMRELALDYVGSPRFQIASEVFGEKPGFDIAIAVWVLQHCPNLKDDISHIKRCLRPGGSLFVVNMLHRSVPTMERGWVSDNLDVFTLLDEAFEFVTGGPLDPAHTTPRVAAVSGWAVYRRLPPET